MKGGEKKGTRAGRGALYCAVMAVLALAGWAPPAWAQVELPAQTPDHFLVVTLPAAVAGQTAPITVTAMNGLLPVLGYTGTITFSSTDPQAQLPAPYTFTGFGLGLDNGTHVFATPSLRTAGEHTVSVTATEGIGAATVIVSAGPADHLGLSGPASVTAGVPFSLTISARDLYQNTATLYLGAIALTSSDAQAQMVANYVYLPADLGSHTFTVELRTAGAQTITATDLLLPVQTGTYSTSVAPGTATRFEITTSGTANAGQPLSVTVTARDSFGNAATGFTGTAHFTSSDDQATLPADYTFGPADLGTHTFTGVVLRRAGEQTIATSDPGNPDLGGSAVVTVAAGPATHLTAKAPPSGTSGTPFGISVTARDAFENVAGSYAGTLHFTSTGAQADLPANYTFNEADNGSHFFNGIVLRTAGTQSVTASDIVSPMSATVTLTISAGAASQLSLSGPGQAGTNAPITITVAARDAASNVAVDYIGTVHFTSSDKGATLPADYTFTEADQGVRNFLVTMASAGTQTVQAADLGSPSVAGSITVNVIVAHLDAAALSVDATAGSSSNGNGVLEAGETVGVAPSWSNNSGGVLATTSQAEGWSGPGIGSGASYTVNDGSANYGTLANGQTVSCSEATGDCFSLGLNSAGVRPLLHWDGSFTEALANGGSKTWTLHVGDSFTDVSRSSIFYRFIETLLHRNVTGGCGDTTFCPTSSSTRAQMAAFTFVAKEGVSNLPPACVAGSEMFADVPASSPYCRFIEELSRRGAVGGCAVNPARYCPEDAVTREQMAVFVLRTLDTSSVPAACVAGSETFEDVPASSPYCRYIEELARRHVVTGCSTSPSLYCPSVPVSREQMSVFITLTFGLTLYGL